MLGVGVQRRNGVGYGALLFSNVKGKTRKSKEHLKCSYLELKMFWNSENHFFLS
jgi:hypothetical protein